MMKQMSIGTYYLVSTYLHELDARVKVLATTIVMTLLFFLSSFWSFLLIFCCIVGLFIHARLPLLLNGIKSMRLFLVFTVILSMFLVPGESILFEWHGIYMTLEGLNVGLILVTRIILMLFTTTILMMTTTSIELTNAMAFLFSPLQKLRLPVAEAALMINLALRFVPTLMEEKDRIVNAQKARGVNFEEGSISDKAKNLIPVIIPLILSAFKRADDLALAMEARCFKIGRTRTSYRLMKMTAKDYVGLLIMLAFFIAILAFEYLVWHIL